MNAVFGSLDAMPPFSVKVIPEFELGTQLIITLGVLLVSALTASWKWCCGRPPPAVPPADDSDDENEEVD